MKDLFTLLAILSAIPGAWLSFKRSFYLEIAEQANDEQFGERYVSWFYRRIMLPAAVGLKAKPDHFLEPMSPYYHRVLLKKSRHMAFLVFLSFFCAFLFSFLAWYSGL